MQNMKRCTAFVMVLCLLLGYALSVGPMASDANAVEYDPYVFILGPESSTVPEYYQTYAKPFVGWSPFEVEYKKYAICRWFNLTNVDEIQPQKPAGFDDLPLMEKLHASTQAFCGDRGTDYYFTYRYRRINLEDAHFAVSGTSEALNKAKKVRAIVRHAMPYIADPEVVQAAANAYFGSEKVVTLTNEELASATQAAIWQYTDDLFGTADPYFCWADFKSSANSGFAYKISQCISETAPLNISALERFVEEDGKPVSLSGRNINRVYEYLVNLPGEEAYDILIGMNALSLEDMFLEGSGSNCNLTLYIDINGTINEDDDLVLTATCGDQTQTLTIDGSGDQCTADGLYPITFTGVNEADCSRVKLDLTGSQTVEDAVFFEAEPRDGKDAKETSQGFVGMGPSTGPVGCTTTVNPLNNAATMVISKVDEKTGNPLSGVSFDLYKKQAGGDVKVASVVTDANGKAYFAAVDLSNYYFVETGALPGYEAITGNITTDRITNSWNAGALEVSKKLINETPAKPDETFDFSLTLDLSTAPLMGNGISWMTGDYIKSQLVSTKALTWSVSGNTLTADFTLNADETVKIDSIPLGATYTLKENLTQEERALFNVTTKVDNGSAVKSDTAQGTIAAHNAVVFTNSVVTGELKLGELKVSKKLVNTTPAQVGETFDFKITLDLTTADIYDGSLPWVTDEYLMEQVTSDENLTWTKENGKYVAEFTVDAGETITISGIPQGVTYTVEETFEGDKENWFTVTTKVDDDDEKISKLADGTIAEKNAVIFTNTVVTTELKQGDLNVSKHLVNTTPAQVGETFDFKITLDLSTADVYTDPVFWMNDAYLMGKITSDENLAWIKVNGKYTATFTVDAEETVIIKGIPYGATYTLEEELDAEGLEKFSVTTQVGNEKAKDGTTATGTISSINAVLFTNTVADTEVKLGDLSVSKKLVNTTPAVVGETFNFKITLDLSTADVYTDPVFWMNDAYLMGKVTSDENLAWIKVNGKYTATFTVDAEETVTIKGIPYGTTYTVEENLTAEDLEWFSVTSQVGNETAKNSSIATGTVSSINAVLFTNTVVSGDELRLGDLEISKKLVNTSPAVVGETFNFKVTLDLSTANAYANAAPWLNDEYLMDQITSTKNLTWTRENGKYTATFTVNAGETVTIKGIAYGVTYTVEEILTAADLEKFTVTSQINSEAANNSAIAQGTVAQGNAVKFTNTVADSELKLGELKVSKELVNTTPAEVGETFDFKITLDLTTADVYTDPVFWMNDEYLMDQITSSEDLTWTEENGKYVAEFTVDAGETVTIDGIAQGVTYTVEETFEGDKEEWFTVTTKVDDDAEKVSKLADGTIAEKNAVIFTNTVVTADVKLGELKVSKKLINTTPAVVGETFNFKITLDLTTADVYTDPVFWMNDEYLMAQITSSEDLTWTKENGKYIAEFTVDAGETVTIDGIAQGATYTVEEILTAEDRAWFTVTTQVNSETPKDGETASGSIAEKNAVLFTNTVVSGDDVRVGNLNVSKNLINTTPAVVGETFNFKITLDLSTADAYDNAAPWLDDAYLLGKISSSENLTWTKENGKYIATFTVDAGETVVIKGIAYGVTYTVEEILTAEDREHFSVTTQVGNEKAKDGETATGSIANINAVLFTNSVFTADVKLGELKVSKELVNTTPAEVGETFDFKITLDLTTADVYTDPVFWMNDEYLMDQITSSEDLTWTKENGKYVAEFTVDAGETVTIDGIAQGVTYTVEETFEGDKEEWFTVTTKVDDDAEKVSKLADGTIAEKNAVIFTNTVVTADVKLGDLHVSKKLINTTPAVVGETFNFKITLDLTTADVYTDPVFWMNDEYLMAQITSTENLTWTKENGKYTAAFTVDAEETVSIKGIAHGVTYTVEEILTAEDRAWFSVTTQVGNEASKNSDTATGTVANINAVLFTNTVVTGDELRVGDLDISKKLINTTPAVVGETFNFRITLDLSTADAYDNAAPWLDDAYLLGKISSSENLTWTEENGKYTATFTVDADETVTIRGIAYGVTYTVEEILTAEDRQWFTVTSQVNSEEPKDCEAATGSVAQGNAVIFTNSVVTAELKLGGLNVSKNLINTTPAEVGETFNFKITLDLSTAEAYDGSIPWMNDEYLIGKVTSDENLTWTKKDGKYTATFTVDAGETVTIDGIAQGVTYTVEEILTAEDRAWFTVTTQVNSETPKDGETASGSIAEKNAVLFTNTVVSGDDVRVGNLNVSKNLINTTPAVVGETFNFKITLDLSTADAYDNAAPWLDDAYLLGKISSDENLTWTKENGKYTAAFTVDAGETVVIKGIAYGVTYTVEEILTAEDREHFSVTTQVGNEKAKDGETATGSIASINAVLFTNSVFTTEVKLGDLEVSKELINTTPAEVGETFDFKITLDLTTADVYTDSVFWMNDEYLMGQITSTENLTWTKENGKYVAEFTVDAGETVTIDGIAQGVTYTVEETFEGDKDEWFTVTTKVNDEAEEISELADGTIAEKNAVIFTNTVVTTELKLGDLNVSKKLINTTPAVVGETFNFKITLDLTTADVYTDPVFWMNDEYLMDQITSTENLTWTKENGKYTATFTVDAEETVSIKGIAQGVTYTVEEILTAEDLAWFSVTTQVGNEAPKNSNTATGAVANINAVLFTNTVVTGDELRVGDLDISKKLINTTPAVVGETFNFKITLDLSTADAYDNAAPWLDDAYLLGKISSSENLTWTKENGKYTATFTVDADETVTLRGIAYGVTYTVEEILTAEDRQWFTVTSQVNSEAPKDSEIATGSVAQGNAVIFTNSVVTAELKLGGLNVSKNLINTTPAEVGETFNFKITLDLSTAEAYDGSIPWMNDEYLIGKVTSDENLTWTKKDGKYTATFTVDAGETVVIKGIAYGATYTVEEIMTAEDREWFTVTSQVGNAAPKNSNTAEGSIAQINAVLFTNTVVTGPELKPAVLTVSKELINTTPAEVGETFNFRITLDLSTADVYVNAAPWMNDGYLMEQISSAEDLTWTEKDSKYTAEFTVNADEAVAIEGIAFGTSYTVEEIMTEEDREWFSVTTQAGEEAPQAAAYARGIVAERNALIFTNTVKSGPELKLGELAVSKKLINTTPAVVGETFNFRITLDLSTADVYVDPAPWMSNAYLMDQITSEENLIWTEQDGKYVADFTVDADETVTIGGIAYGTSYTVEEVLTEEDREWFESNAQIGDTPVEGTSVSGTVAKHNAVIFTNSVVTGPVLETGSVEVSKKLINTTPAEVGETFNFKITLDLSTADVYVNAAPWMNDEYLMSFITGSKELTWTEKDGKYTADFNVNADDTFAITGIACGASYTVEEILTEEDRECFTVTTQIGEEEAVDGTGVSGTVAERNALIFTNTVVTTEVKLGELEVSKKLVNTTPAVVGETFNFKITLDLTTADVYADPVFWINDEYLMSLITGSEELTWTEQDGKYTAEFTVDADETVTIGGIACGTSYTVEEIQTEEDREWFTVTTQIGEEEAVEGTSVEGAVAEKNALIFTNSVVTTELNLGKLEVSKKLINATAANKDEAFNFSIVIDFSKADVYINAVPWMNNDYLLQQVKSTKELTWTKSGTNTYTATFTLKADEAITIEGIAMGSGYTVQEELTKADRSVYQVTTRITTDGTAAAEDKSYVVCGNIAAENAVRFTNKYIQKDVPVTGDFGLTLPMMLCLLSMLAVVTLLLNRRRFL